ncbi:MAG: PEGA domain-containing protein, partial [Myxococcota bacterium]
RRSSRKTPDAKSGEPPQHSPALAQPAGLKRGDTEAVTTVDFLPTMAPRTSSQNESRSGPRRRRAPAPRRPEEDGRPRRPQSAPAPMQNVRSSSRNPHQGAKPSAENHGSRLTLPSPKKASSAQQDAASPATTPQPDTLGFSSEGLVDRLNEGPPSSSSTEEPGAYRELYITIAVVVVLLVGAVVYQFTRPKAVQNTPVVSAPIPDEQRPLPPPTAPPPTERTAPAPHVQPQRATSRGETAKTRTATPMLSVVSMPGRAIVDIDGVVYGRTPLIMPSPRNAASLQITIKLPGYKTHSEQLSRNAAGHFSLNVKLEPVSPR